MVLVIVGGREGGRDVPVLARSPSKLSSTRSATRLGSKSKYPMSEWRCTTVVATLSSESSSSAVRI